MLCRRPRAGTGAWSSEPRHRWGVRIAKVSGLGTVRAKVIISLVRLVPLLGLNHGLGHSCKPGHEIGHDIRMLGRHVDRLGNISRQVEKHRPRIWAYTRDSVKYGHTKAASRSCCKLLQEGHLPWNGKPSSPPDGTDTLNGGFNSGPV